MLARALVRAIPSTLLRRVPPRAAITTTAAPLPPTTATMTDYASHWTQPLTTGRWAELPDHDAAIPTNVHLDLQRAGKIPDPFLGLGERAAQWVMDSDFTFVVPVPKPDHAPGERVELVLEGLDTFATVSIAGEEVLKSDNMFLAHRIDITKLYAKALESGIEIKFESAKRLGDQRLQKYGKRVCWNGHYSRVYVRKAQYHYGWDWGPSLVTCGPWKPIYLEHFSARLDSVDVEVVLSGDLKLAQLAPKAVVGSTVGDSPSDVTVSVVINSPSGKELSSPMYPPHDGLMYEWSAGIDIESPELWHPRGLGAPNLYTAVFTLTQKSSGAVLHTVKKRFGLRRVELVRDALPANPENPLAEGSTFYFRINEKPVFCGGSNWIPADSFQPRITRDGLRHWLHTLLAERGLQNMVRVWGGGVYESEDFYELCDEAGVMVWQDVCFACGDYPAHLEWFASSVQEELSQNLKRLKWHPSLVIVAGSNEDYQVADEEVGYEPDAPEETWQQEPFPSRYLYEKGFAEIVQSICNGYSGELIGEAGADGAGVLYWPGSPFGGIDSTDRTVGDLHQWNIWGGIQAPYQRYPDLGGRFISEFGMISLPSIETIKNGFLAPDSPATELHPQSETLAHHVKAHSFEKRMLAYIAENFRFSTNSMEEFIYLSQMVQADAMSTAYKSWRERWGASLHNRSCGGILVWQMNDCWPVTSWAIADYYARPKAAFYSIARALRPLVLSTRRTTTGVYGDNRVDALANSKTIKGARISKLHATPHAYPEKRSRARVSLSSIAQVDQPNLNLQIDFVNIATGERKTVFKKDVTTAKANDTEVLWEGDVPEDVPTLVYARAADAKLGAVLATDTDWPQPLKWVTFPDRGVVVVDVAGTGGEGERVVTVSADKPVKNLWFKEADGEAWSDNGVDVVPGEKIVLAVKGWVPRDLMWRAYGPRKFSSAA